MTDALEQLEQLYMMRLLHQTLRERLEQAHEAVNGVRTLHSGPQRITFRAGPPPSDDDDEGGSSPSGRGFLFDAFQLPHQLEEMMMMRAIALSLQQIQPSSAPPPISAPDSAKLERVMLSDLVIDRLRKHDHPECPICQEDFSSFKDQFATRLPCDHVFCVGCLKTWLESSRTCPVCRLELVDVETLYNSHSSSPSRKKSVLAITPPASPATFARSQPSVSSNVSSRPQAAIIAASLSSMAQPQPRTPPRHYNREADAYFQPGVGSRTQQAVAELRQMHTGIVEDSSSSSSSSAWLSAEESDGGGEHTSEQQALLDEILRRRDEQQQRTIMPLQPSERAQPAPVTLPSTTDGMMMASTDSVATIDNSRRNSQRPVAQPQRQPAPPVSIRTKSTTRPTVAVPTVGRVRPAPRPNETGSATTSIRRPNAPVTTTTTTSTVGVRGLLNRTRNAPSSSQQQ